jgi:hypothetical protein
MTVRQYATPLAFKQALEQRLRSTSITGADFARRRQLLVFDRYLARLTQIVGDAVTLKGGLALELRLSRATDHEGHRAIESTFEFRGTHRVPVEVPPPPAFWEVPYGVMAANDELAWTTLSELAKAVTTFLDPVLASADRRTWQPDARAWSS